MQIADIKQNSSEWHEFRLGKIRGSNLKELWQVRQYTVADITKFLEAKGVEFKKSAKKPELEALLSDEEKIVLSASGEKKLEFYNIIAEKLAVVPDDEERMDRGHRLEDVAVQRFTEETGKTVEKVGCCISDVDERIINSPDGLILSASDDELEPRYREAVEVKCLSPGRHLMAMCENKVPDEYFCQMVQYFVVNEHLEKLYFTFYDERFKYKNLQFHVVEVNREDLKDWPDIFLKYQLNQLKEMDEIIERLAF